MMSKFVPVNPSSSGKLAQLCRRMCSSSNIDGSDAGKRPEAIAPADTMNNVKTESHRLFGIQPKYSVLQQSREYLLKFEPKSLAELPVRSMADSFTSAIIPLSSDAALQDKYVTFLGNVRLGRLMEDMDHFAVWVMQQHVKIPNLDPSTPLPFNFVTVFVDKISFTDNKPKNDQDIRLWGHVTHVGRSTAEVVVRLEQKQMGTWHELTHALFLMASRNAVNTQAALINPLKPATDEEKIIFDAGEQRKKHRLQMQKESIFSQQPNDYEQKLIHGLFTSTIDSNSEILNERRLPADAVWMEKAIMSNHIFSHPEDRNAHTTVFGGFVMRHALELSWALAYKFSKSRPKLEHISDISFLRPIPVGSIIEMTARVIYVDINYMEIVVTTNAMDRAGSLQATTNQLFFTYSSTEKVSRILPRTYLDSLWYLQGRRKFNAAMGLDGKPIAISFPTLEIKPVDEQPE